MQHTFSFTRIVPALTILALACGGNGDDAARAPAAAAPIEIENAATVSGRIAFEGSPPALQSIDMRDEPACAERFDEGYPHAHAVVVEDGGLRNVFVYVSEGVSGTFPAAGEPPVIDQRACIYTPRVVGVQTGQQLIFRNSDNLLHNIRSSPTVNRGFNRSQPRNMDTPVTFSSREVMIPIACDVHGWMSAYVGVLDHPYYAVSAADGSFEIGNLAPGTYTVTTWHERYGEQSQQITVGPDERAELNFSYSEAMAGRHVPLAPPFDPHAHHVVASAHDH
jgi:hypothetical protein